MSDTRWKEATEHWRSLPEEERRHRHVEAIPRLVARSMAMESEPVDEVWIWERLERHCFASRNIDTSVGILSF